MRMALLKASLVEVRNYPVGDKGPLVYCGLAATDAEKTRDLSCVLAEHRDYVAGQIDAKARPTEDERSE